MTLQSSKRKLVPPDGGWGWMVVLGTSIANTFNQSLLSIFGLLFGDKLIEMGETTVGVSWVGNIMLLITNFSGLISGPALKKFSARKVAVIGSVLAGVGMIASSFATSSWHLILTYSVLTGLGIGLIQPSSFIAVVTYFKTKKNTAVGLSMVGTGVGQMLMPHLVKLFLDNYGYFGTSLFLGALAFNGIVGAALFQPVKWHMKREDSAVNEETMLLSSRSKSYGDKEPLLPPPRAVLGRSISSEGQRTVLEDISMSVPLNYDEEMERTKQKCVRSYSVGAPSHSFSEKKFLIDVKRIERKDNTWQKIKNFLDLDLLLDFTFLNIILGCGLGFTSNQNFNMLFPFFLQQELGLDRSQTAMCMSAIAGTSIIGRLIFPAAADRFKISSRFSFIFGCTMLGVSRIVLCIQTQYIPLLLASGLCGFFRSALVVNQNLTVSEYCKDKENKLPIALGFNMVMKGICIISIGQFLGWVRDYTQSYIICMYAQNVLLAVTALLWIFELFVKYICR